MSPRAAGTGMIYCLDLYSRADPHVYVWHMRKPMAPIKKRLTLRSGRGSHWLTVDIDGDYAYIAGKNSDDATEVFYARSNRSVGVIGSLEDMLKIDSADGKISRMGDQYGIGREENPCREGRVSPDGK
jgi:hypothetical protein